MGGGPEGRVSPGLGWWIQPRDLVGGSVRPGEAKRSQSLAANASRRGPQKQPCLTPVIDGEAGGLEPGRVSELKIVAASQATDLPGPPTVRELPPGRLRRPAEPRGEVGDYGVALRPPAS